MGKNKAEKQAQAGGVQKEVDIFRETPLRYCGYANEVGEAFRLVFPQLLRPSYFASYAYVAGDVLDKFTKQKNKEGAVTLGVAVAALDTMLWQCLASVIVPGFVIHKVVDATAWTVQRASAPASLAKALPVAAGLATIPFVVEPIDHLVTVGMDKSIRKVWTALNVQGLGSGH